MGVTIEGEYFPSIVIIVTYWFIDFIIWRREDGYSYAKKDNKVDVE
jgi:hypothetical protein